MSAQSRRKFLGSAGSAVAAGAFAIGCGESKQEVSIPELRDSAPDGPELKAGLVGCGGRGKGAAINFLKAGPNLKITALADVFQDRIDEGREHIQKESISTSNY